LRDAAIEASPAQVASGAVRFDVRNAGSAVYELEVFRVPAGVESGALPVVNHVADTGGLEVVDEAEECTQRSASADASGHSAGEVVTDVAGHRSRRARG
jgi:hypothetical protein